MPSLPSNKRSRKYSTARTHWLNDLVSAAKFGSNLVDSSGWTVGSSLPAGWTSLTTAGETSIISDYGPGAEKIPIVLSTPSGDNGNDGGFMSPYAAFDSSKAYRFAMFHRRTGATNGSAYTMIRCGGGSNLLYDVGTGTGATEVYPYAGDYGINSGWVVIIGYVFGSAHAGTENIGGIYDLSTGAKLLQTNSFKPNSACTSIQASSFFQDAAVGSRLYQTKPRIDLIDGSEPPLALLLASLATFTASYSEKIVTGAAGETNFIYVQTSQPAMTTGDFWIDYSSGENRCFSYSATTGLAELKPFFKSSDATAASQISMASEDDRFLSLTDSGKRLIRKSGVQRYTATIQYPPQTPQQFGRIDAFLTQRRNLCDTFKVSLPIRQLDYAANIGTPLINGGSQSGYSIVTDGWMTGFNPAAIPAGAFFKIEGSEKIYCLGADVSVDYAGSATLKLAQKLQFTPADNARIFFINPEMECNLISVHKFDVSPPELYSYEIDVEEVIT